MKGNKLQYLSMPIYSVTCYKQCVYFSGGGGGKTGIPNQIIIYQSILQVGIVPTDRLIKVDTGSKIAQNLVINQGRSLLASTENQMIVLYAIEENGRRLRRLITFKADQSPKNPTLNALSFNKDGTVLVSGGDDKIVKFFQIRNLNDVPNQINRYQAHKNSIRNIDCNDRQLVLSTDTNQIVIYNINTKQIVRKVYNDQLQPHHTLIQAAYFQNQISDSVLIVHYKLRERTYISKQLLKSGHNVLESLEIGTDQSCLTYYKRNKHMLGVSCGNGTTYLFNTKTLQSYGNVKKHNFVITANLITQQQKYITGTPQCSFNIQSKTSGYFIHILTAILVLLVLIMPQMGDVGQL